MVASTLTRRLPRTSRAFESRVAWIFGSPRSGSTWVMTMLDDHPSVVAVNEPQIGTYLSPFLCDVPGFEAAKLEPELFSLRQVPDEPAQFFAEEFSDVWVGDLRRLILDRLRAHVERNPPAVGARRAVAVIKEPNGSQSADLIMRVLPRAALLFLLRDGRDVVDSELAANRPDGWVAQLFPGVRGIRSADERLEFVRRAAHKWLCRTEMVQRAYEAHRGPKLLLRYEELLVDPEPHMRELFDLLGLEIADTDLQALVERRSFANLPAAQRGANRFFRAASPGLWRENLGAAEQAALEAIMGAKLRELDYA